MIAAPGLMSPIFNPQRTMNVTTQPEQEKWSQVVAQCWMDPQYQARLVREPEAVLREAGLSLPAGIKVQVIADTPAQQTLVIPPPPAAGEIGASVQSRKAAMPVIYSWPPK